MKTWEMWLESVEGSLSDAQYAAVMDHIKKMKYRHLEGHTKESLAEMGVRTPADLERVLRKDAEAGKAKDSRRATLRGD